MRLVVGYVPNRGGAEAVHLAATLAGGRDATLDVIVVLPDDSPTFDMYSPDKIYQAALAEHGEQWLADALSHVPAGVEARGLIRRGESITEGLISAATDPELGEVADGIVIGASHRGVMGFFTIGSVAAALLHASPVPVALAPRGYEGYESVTRLTCATGERQGAEALVDVAIEAAAARTVPLRLMSLVALDKPLSAESRAARLETARQHVDGLVAQAVAALPSEVPVTGEVGTGRSLEQCVQSLDFEPSELVLLGSSRLARPNMVFLGASADKMMRVLPVPMVVVPRDFEPTSRM